MNARALHMGGDAATEAVALNTSGLYAGIALAGALGGGAVNTSGGIGVLVAACVAGLPTGGPVFELLGGVLLAALGRMGADGWAVRLRLSRRRSARTPSTEARHLAFCDRTGAAIATVMQRRFDMPVQPDPYGLRLRLAVDLLAAVFRRALERWVADPSEFGHEGLADALRDACAAVPESLTLPARPR